MSNNLQFKKIIEQLSETAKQLSETVEQFGATINIISTNNKNGEENQQNTKCKELEQVGHFICRCPAYGMAFGCVC